MSPPSWTSLPSPTPSLHSLLSQSTGLSSLGHTASLAGYLFYLWPCICFHAPLSIRPTLSFPQCPQICSLCLRLHCCPANRFISTIFLESIHELIYIFFLFLTYFTLCNRFIHLIRTDSNAFLLWLRSIPLYICTIGSLSINLLLDILGSFHVLAIVNSVQLQRTLGYMFLFQLWFPDCWVIC